MTRSTLTRGPDVTTLTVRAIRDTVFTTDREPKDIGNAFNVSALTVGRIMDPTDSLFALVDGFNVKMG